MIIAMTIYRLTWCWVYGAARLHIRRRLYEFKRSPCLIVIEVSSRKRRRRTLIGGSW